MNRPPCALRLLNATARFGPEIAQDALSSPDLRVETHHLLSFVLALCSSEWDSAVAAGDKARRDRKSGKKIPPRASGASGASGAAAAETRIGGEGGGKEKEKKRKKKRGRPSTRLYYYSL